MWVEPERHQWMKSVSNEKKPFHAQTTHIERLQYDCRSIEHHLVISVDVALMNGIHYLRPNRFDGTSNGCDHIIEWHCIKTGSRQAWPEALFKSVSLGHIVDLLTRALQILTGVRWLEPSRDNQPIQMISLDGMAQQSTTAT